MDILLVEDNSSDAYLLKEVFATQVKNANIHWVASGYEALDYLHRRKDYEQAARPDIILLDINMPRISGFEVLKDIKANTPLADIPTVIITTSRDPLDHTQCKALGADMCLSKPQGLKDYQLIVQQLMNWVPLVVDQKPARQTS